LVQKASLVFFDFEILYFSEKKNCKICDFCPYWFLAIQRNFGQKLAILVKEYCNFKTKKPEKKILEYLEIYIFRNF